MPGGHWIRAISIFIFGKSMVGIRMPSVIFSLLSLISIYRILRSIRCSIFNSLIPLLLITSCYRYFYFSRLALNEVIGISLFLLTINIIISDSFLNKKFNYYQLIRIIL